MATKILIVDDSSTARMLLKMCLKKLGEFEILETGNTEEAKRIVNISSPDICIFDYNMPDETGTELGRVVLKQKSDLSLILMTANMQETVVREAKDAGFLAFIEKPVDADKVSAALERVT